MSLHIDHFPSNARPTSPGDAVSHAAQRLDMILAHAKPEGWPPSVLDVFTRLAEEFLKWDPQHQERFIEQLGKMGSRLNILKRED